MNTFAATSRRFLATSRPTFNLLPLPLARRYASVLAAIPAQAQSEADLTAAPLPPACPTGSATLSSEPLTAVSNNAFHPANLPKGTRARLTMSELVKMLEASREILGFLEKQCAESKEQQEKTRSVVEALIREQKELRERLSGGASAAKFDGKDESDKK